MDGGPPISLPLSLSAFDRLRRSRRRVGGGKEDWRRVDRDGLSRGLSRSRSSRSSMGDMPTALIGTCTEEEEGEEEVEAEAEVAESIENAVRADVEGTGYA